MEQPGPFDLEFRAGRKITTMSRSHVGGNIQFPPYWKNPKRRKVWGRIQRVLDYQALERVEERDGMLQMYAVRSMGSARSP